MIAPGRPHQSDQPHAPRATGPTTAGRRAARLLRWAGWVGALGSAGVLLGCSAGGGTADPGRNIVVEVTRCEFSGGSFLRLVSANLSVTNRSDRSRSVKIQIEYLDRSGRRLEKDTVRLRSIEPGQTVETNEVSFVDRQAFGGIQCLTRVV